MRIQTALPSYLPSVVPYRGPHIGFHTLTNLRSKGEDVKQPQRCRLRSLGRKKICSVASVKPLSSDASPDLYRGMSATPRRRCRQSAKRAHSPHWRRGRYLPLRVDEMREGASKKKNQRGQGSNESGRVTLHGSVGPPLMEVNKTSGSSPGKSQSKQNARRR